VPAEKRLEVLTQQILAAEERLSSLATDHDPYGV
jgi:hypothetical protein